MGIISSDISRAATILSNEDVVAIPTETVYGLAGNIYSDKAINAIFRIKNRPLFNPLIVHIGSSESLQDVAREIPEKAKLLADTFWPGSLTLVLPKKTAIPRIITAGKDTVAVRVPNHAATLALLKQLPFPLAAPSANPFGSISPTTAKHVENYFKNSIQMVLDGGPCKNGIESTIVGFEAGQPVIYRLGSISVEDIENVVGTVLIKNKKELKPDAPGMLARHYAPATKTILTDNIQDAIATYEGKKIGILTFKSAIASEFIKHQIRLSKNGDLKEAMSNLYLALHELDQLELDVIIAEKLPDYGLGKSMNDRLHRATFAG